MSSSASHPIFVTKTFLPPKVDFLKYVDKIWQTNQLTNNGPLSHELEKKISQHLGLNKANIRVVANGTLALQLALRALNITEGEVITTPFSYVATTSAILWERCEPVYVDIDSETLNINPRLIEQAITPKTKAIMPVHVFGNPCNTKEIEKIAKKNNLKVIYDASHSFGVSYMGKSLFDYGDISTCSFHATKLFHTNEGGLVHSTEQGIVDKVELLKRFGHNGDNHIMLGMNAKLTEFNAAMGLCNLRYVERIIEDRKRASKQYDSILSGFFKKPVISKGTDYNYSYYPIIFTNQVELLAAKKRLENNNIYARRYFYPTLNTLAYAPNRSRCPVSEDLSRRILCLPLYYQIRQEDIKRICDILIS